MAASAAERFALACRDAGSEVSETLTVPDEDPFKARVERCCLLS
jgi:hypothetical protein